MSKIYYSMVNGGFYSDDKNAHGSRTIKIRDHGWTASGENPDASAPLMEIPNPACSLPPAEELIEITWDEHDGLMRAQATGKQIEKGKNGKPIAVDPPPPSIEQLKASANAWVSAQLATTELVVSRYRDERDMGEETTLSASRYVELLAYRKALRLWEESKTFPDEKERPAGPAWL